MFLLFINCQRFIGHKNLGSAWKSYFFMPIFSSMTSAFSLTSAQFIAVFCPFVLFFHFMSCIHTLWILLVLLSNDRQQFDSSFMNSTNFCGQVFLPLSCQACLKVWCKNLNDWFVSWNIIISIMHPSILLNGKWVQQDHFSNVLCSENVTKLHHALIYSDKQLHH